MGVFLGPRGAGSGSKGAQVLGATPGREALGSAPRAQWAVAKQDCRLGEEGPDSSASCPGVQWGGLFWPPVRRPLLPPPGPSAARRRPPAVPRALYQIINKSAGAARVNILAGLKGGLPEVASAQASRASHPHPGSNGPGGSASPLLGACPAPVEMHMGEGQGTQTQGALALWLLVFQKGSPGGGGLGPGGPRQPFPGPCPHSLSTWQPPSRHEVPPGLWQRKEQ